MNDKLILRGTDSPYGDVNKGSVISHGELDDNFLYLKGNEIYSASSSMNIITLIKNNGNNLEIPISTTEIYTTGLTFNQTNYILTGTRNDGITYSTNLSILASDVTITGGTYNINTGVATFTNNSGATFGVSGFLTGMTDTFVTGGTANNSTKQYVFTNNTGGIFTVNGLSDINVTGGTYSNGTTIFTNTTGGTFSISGYSNGTITGILSNGYVPRATGTSTLTSGCIQDDGLKAAVGGSVESGFTLKVNGNFKANGYAEFNGGGTFNGGLVASSFTKPAGTSNQFLKANGTVDSNTYLTSTDITGKEDKSAKTSDFTLTSIFTYPNSKALSDGLVLKATLASPNLTGTPTAPTATAGTNTTQIATTAFVDGAVASNKQFNNVVIDSYSGTRLTPVDATLNGFSISKSINGAIGYVARNTDDVGNGSVTNFVAGGSTSSPYSNNISMSYAHANYFVPYLRNAGFISSDKTIYNISTGGNIDFRTGVDLSSATTKLLIGFDGTITAPSQTYTLINAGGIHSLITKEYVDGQVVTNTTTTGLSEAQLNAAYPTAILGFRVIAKSIIAGGLLYTKENGTSWVFTTIGSVI